MKQLFSMLSLMNALVSRSSANVSMMIPKTTFRMTVMTITYTSRGVCITGARALDLHAATHEIVDELEREQSVAGRGGVDDRADVATAQALVDAVEEAHEEIFAHGDVFVGVIVQNHVIREDREGDDRVDVDDDPAQHCGEEDGPAVGGNGERDSHQILGLCEDVEQMNREEEGRRRQPEDRGDEEDRVERKRRVLQI
eukprot:4523605-Prymnesium_polylepis.1